MCPSALRFALTGIRQPITGGGETSHTHHAYLEQKKTQIHEYLVSSHTLIHDRCVLDLKECQNHSLQFPCAIRAVPFIGAIGFVAPSHTRLPRISLGLELFREENGIRTDIFYLETFQLHLSLVSEVVYICYISATSSRIS